MEFLKDIIKENITWFWDNDPLLETETDNEKLWNGFKVWCIQNCIEVLKSEKIDIQEEVIIKEVNNMYNEWLKAR